MFAIASSSWEDGNDCDEPGILTCPFCMRSFDPFAPSQGRHGSHESAGLDELFNVVNRDDEDEGDSNGDIGG